MRDSLGKFIKNHEVPQEWRKKFRLIGCLNTKSGEIKYLSEIIILAKNVDFMVLKVT